MKLKNSMKHEAKRLLDDKKSGVYPEIASRRRAKGRRALIAALVSALIAALVVPFVVIALNKPTPEAPTPTPTAAQTVVETESAQTPAQPTETNEPTEKTAESVPTQTADDGSLPRVPADTPLYFSVNPAYLEANNVAVAYAPDAGEQLKLEKLLTGGYDYRKLDRLVSRFRAYTDENGEIAFDTVPFVFWGTNGEGAFKACDLYYFFEIDAAEMGLSGAEFSLAHSDVRFTFELWYRIAGSGEDFKGIRTTLDTKVLPYVYDLGSDYEVQPVVIRIPTYNEGIRDLHSDHGEPLDYEFLIVIRDTSLEGDDVIGWKNITVTITGDYEKLLSEGFEQGLLELPQ